jgi:hypothetical protein
MSQKGWNSQSSGPKADRMLGGEVSVKHRWRTANDFRGNGHGFDPKQVK